MEYWMWMNMYQYSTSLVKKKNNLMSDKNKQQGFVYILNCYA